MNDERCVSLLNYCIKEINSGFEGSSWMRFRIHEKYRDVILCELQKKFPQYDIQASEITGIWIEGDENIHREVIIKRVEAGARVLDFFPEKYTKGLLTSLQERFPMRQFKVMKKIETNTNVITVDGCIGTEMVEQGLMSKYYTCVEAE